ncbi:MAG: hypothetical protein AAF664_13815, partial [Planctomycetota bacterium]
MDGTRKRLDVISMLVIRHPIVAITLTAFSPLLCAQTRIKRLEKRLLHRNPDVASEAIDELVSKPNLIPESMPVLIESA